MGLLFERHERFMIAHQQKPFLLRAQKTKSDSDHYNTDSFIGDVTKADLSRHFKRLAQGLFVRKRGKSHQ